MVSDTRWWKHRPFLLTHNTNQQAELIALTCAFQLLHEQSLNMYTESNYVFHILISYTAICYESGSPTTKEGSLAYANHIRAMLKASHFPQLFGLYTADSTRWMTLLSPSETTE
jgi:ribonuclease HI